jgi:predicted glycoside hydrolase/deacetylase ChbG (UPF0249 family)
MAHLVITCDDLGMHPTVNEAVVAILERGVIRAASLLATGVHFDDAVRRLHVAGISTVGVHLCLGSEYPRLPMRPVLPDHTVPTLLAADGFFHDDIARVRDTLNLRQVEMELRAQIQKVLDSGLGITHLDGHMFFYEEECGGTKLQELVQDLGTELGVHVRHRRQLPTICIWDDVPSPDGRRQFYEHFLNNYAGPTAELIIHPGMNAEQLGHFTAAGARRTSDYQYFISLCPRELSQRGITITDWTTTP